MPFDYQNKTCIVTGGAGGLGLATVRAFHSAGGNVIFTDIVQERIDEALQTFTDQKDRVVGINADVTSTEAMENVFAQALEKFGSVDVVVNNAGINDQFAPIGEVEKAYLEKLIAVNCVAPAMIAGMAVRQFLKQPNKGVICNIASTSAMYGARAGSAYTISKHGVLGLTKSTAAFYGPKGIRSVCIMPGRMEATNMAKDIMTTAHQEGLKVAISTMKSDMIAACPLAEVANCVLSICADGVGSINGACIPVDNAWTSY